MPHDKFSFKSSGRKKDNRVFDVEVSNTVTFGMKTPLTNMQGNTLFDMHTDAIDQIRDNMKNLLMTNHGERVGLYDYGANLYPLLFDMATIDDFEQEVTKRIMESITVYMPGITVDDVQILEMDRTEKTLINKKSLTKLKVRVFFSLIALRATNLTVDIALISGG